MQQKQVRGVPCFRHGRTVERELLGDAIGRRCVARRCVFSFARSVRKGGRESFKRELGKTSQKAGIFSSEVILARDRDIATLRNDGVCYERPAEFREWVEGGSQMSVQTVNQVSVVRLVGSSRERYHCSMHL